MRDGRHGKIGLLPLLISLFLLGYFRANFFSAVEHFLNSPSFATPPTPATKFPFSINGILNSIRHNYLWLASCLYSMLFALHAYLAVWIVYRSRKLATLVLMLYLTLMALSLIFIVFGSLINSFSLGYGLARHIRSLLESPFLIILLIPALQLLKVNGKQPE